MDNRTVDLILFAGQSNMAGRGEAKEAPVCPAEAGMEFKAVSDPALYPIIEPFGREENRQGGIDDTGRKKGSMVSAFVKHYYELTGRQVVAVSASEGGTSSAQWLERMVGDAVERIRRAQSYLSQQEFRVEHTYLLWCQGETDGDFAVSAMQYRENFMRIWTQFKNAGVQQCFLVQIGHFNYLMCPEGLPGTTLQASADGQELDRRYGEIRRAQELLCEENAGDIHMVASFAPYLHLMKDAFHYCQEAYNAVGYEAAGQVAGFAFKD